SLVVELSNATLARLQQALPAAYALPEIDRCLDPTWLRERPSPPSDARSQAEIKTIREAIERTRSLEALGKIDEALPIAETLVERADALGWKPLRARTRLLAGRLSEQQAVEGAAEHLESGFFIALEADEEHLAAELATRLVVAIGVDLLRPSEGHLWARWARALIDRRPVGKEMRLAALNSQLGVLAHSEGHLAEAEHAWQAALSIYEAILGPHHPNIAKLLNNLGALQQLEGNSDEAALLWERALSIWGASLGPDHPTTAAVHVNLGLVYEERAQYSKARASTERALAIWERTLGHKHLKLAPALNNIGHVQIIEGQYSDALTTYKRAHQILVRTFGSGSPSTIEPILGTAKAHTGLGNIEAAAEDYEKVRAIEQRNNNPKGVAYVDSQLASLFLDIDPERAEGHLQGAIKEYSDLYGKRSQEVLQTLLVISEQHLEAGRPAAARPLLEQALGLAQTDASRDNVQSTGAPPDAELIAAIGFALARSLAETGGDRQRIDRLLGRAESLYLGLDPPPKEPVKKLRRLRNSLTDSPPNAPASP
ncbi:MAG TPA: tetratricopeptide repeat protein, partial [Nannocystis exedens]|nr:tetratricopeptide repeat protein [Nannocystis exedens]